MADEIKCDKKTLSEIFDWRYRIPDYQRPYGWENEHVETLLADTFEAYKEKYTSKYFLGSMVLRKIDESEYEVLDGQQRLTTIFLVLAVIRDLSDDKKLADKCREAVVQPEDIYDEKPECLRIEFDIRDDVRDFIDKYVKTDGSTQKIDELKELAKNKTANVSVRNMAEAIITTQKFFQKNPNKLGEYFTYLWKKVVIICIWTEEFDDAFQVFTVLNNRGLKLSNSDILKALNLREVNKAAKATLLKEFEENIYSKNKLRKGRGTFEYIDRLFEIYKKTFAGIICDQQEKFAATNYIRLMRYGLHTDYWKAAVLLFYSKNASERFGEFMKLLDKKISADWICGLSAAKRIENFCAILREVDSAYSAERLFKSKVFTVDLAKLETVLNEAVNSDKKSGYAKYLLLKLDLLYNGDATEFSFSDEISIEHILPQNPPAQSQWQKNFSASEREKWTDKLGNLSLVTKHKNSSLSNLDYEEKKRRYFQQNIERFPNLIRVLNRYDKWTLVELKQNHVEVVSKLLNTYR